MREGRPFLKSNQECGKRLIILPALLMFHNLRI